MRKVLLAALLSLTAASFSGCVLIGPGNTNLSINGTVVGEVHAQSGGLNGYLVTFYPNITEVIRAMDDGKITLNDNNGHPVHCSGSGSAMDVCTIRWLRTFDGSAEWHRATADDEAGDMSGGLDDMPHKGSDCLAVQIKLSGENWTYRHHGDSSCHP